MTDQEREMRPENPQTAKAQVPIIHESMIDIPDDPTMKLRNPTDRSNGEWIKIDEDAVVRCEDTRAWTKNEGESLFSGTQYVEEVPRGEL